MTHYKQYKTSDLTQVFGFISQFPFAHICKNSKASVPDMVHVPVIESPDDNILEFHIAKANPAFQSFMGGGEVTAVFSGPNAHVSPSMYKDRFTDVPRSKTAPTWDYALAEIKGSIEAIDHAELIDHLHRLVSVFENSVDNGWSVEEMDGETFDAWSCQIQGFRFNVSKAQAIFKLSQEQSDMDRRHIASGLRERAMGHDLALAKLIDESLDAE